MTEDVEQPSNLDNETTCFWDKPGFHGNGMLLYPVLSREPGLIFPKILPDRYISKFTAILYI